MSVKPDLQPTVECLAIERLGEPLTEPEQSHLRTCPRCEAEFLLWQSFHDSRPVADEGAAVQWVVSEVRRRRTAAPAPAAPWRGWLTAIGWRPLAGLAVLVLVVGTGVLIRDPEPRIVSPAPGEQTYRTNTVTVVAPTGDLPRPPTVLSWMAVEGASRYDVQVLEVDRVQLWSASASTTRLELPRAVLERVVPGKTLLWTVTAIDGSGRPIAESGLQSFRVSVK